MQVYQGYNGRDAKVLVTPSRPIRAAVGGRNVMPKSYPKPIPVFSAKLLARFWMRVDRRGDADCWPWLGNFNRSGYAAWNDYYAHRIAYTLLRGPIEGGLTIDHVCRNRACMNPAHMEAVTVTENLKRRERGLSSGPKPQPRKRTAERYHRRRERGVCVQCNTPSVKFRCDRCREIHNARQKGRKR